MDRLAFLTRPRRAVVGVVGVTALVFCVVALGAAPAKAADAGANAGGAEIAADDPAAGRETAPEPDDYRMQDYRAPVPATLQGAQVIGVAAAHELWLAGGGVFIDVLPQSPRPPDLPTDVIYRETPRDGIPGAIWLANAGYGVLTPEMDAWFHAELTNLRAASPGKPFVFHCKPDCWMSWNAARRALAYGFDNVIWFPGGTGDWAAAGYPTERLTRVVSPEG